MTCHRRLYIKLTDSVRLISITMAFTADVSTAVTCANRIVEHSNFVAKTAEVAIDCQARVKSALIKGRYN